MTLEIKHITNKDLTTFKKEPIVVTLNQTQQDLKNYIKDEFDRLNKIIEKQEQIIKEIEKYNLECPILRKTINICDCLRFINNNSCNIKSICNNKKRLIIQLIKDTD